MINSDYKFVTFFLINPSLKYFDQTKPNSRQKTKKQNNEQTQQKTTPGKAIAFISKLTINEILKKMSQEVIYKCTCPLIMFSNDTTHEQFSWTMSVRKSSSVPGSGDWTTRKRRFSL